MCLFCDIYQNKGFHLNPEDTIIEVSENFYAKPALGQFIEGYVLINTKKHLPNIAHIEDAEVFDELLKFIDKIKKNIAKITNSDFIVFEHGSLNRFCNNHFCDAKCIDHAHLHLVPLNISVLEALKNNFKVSKLNSIKDLINFKNMVYIFYQNRGGNYVFHVDKHIQSQYVRKLICCEIGISENWNWAQYPFRDKIDNFLINYNRVRKNAIHSS